jgi:hypothetical protein
MVGQVRVEAATTAGWPDLVDELDRWGEAGRVAVLWWRDDDAVAATPQLEDLLLLAGDVPIALAVIPALARPELADALLCAKRIAVLQHGWQHANHAASGKKSEYPEGRPAAVVGAEIGAGRARLKGLFGVRAVPVFVPPWNRLACEILPQLGEHGIAGLSTIASRRVAALPVGLVAIDVHVDVVAWQGNRDFIGTAAALGRIVGYLRTARLGGAAAPPPIGILTHHLVMDRATTAFLDRLIALVGTHLAARWAPAEEFVR